MQILMSVGPAALVVISTLVLILAIAGAIISG